MDAKKQIRTNLSEAKSLLEKGEINASKKKLRAALAEIGADRESYPEETLDLIRTTEDILKIELVWLSYQTDPEATKAFAKKLEILAAAEAAAIRTSLKDILG